LPRGTVGHDPVVRSALMAIVAVLALAGCGGGEERATARPSPASTPDPVATVEPTEVEIRKAANAYVKAYARGDWTGVCDTLVPSERRYFDQLGGSCERVFRSEGRNRRVLRDAIAGEVRIGRDQAVIVIEDYVVDELMRLYAIEEDGSWGIARSKKRREQ
jgi:hypothetical protein